MKNILIIDAQGGGLGRQLTAAIKKELPDVIVTAVGTNSIATSAMLKAGADEAATGENSVRVCAARADVILGPVGIVVADSMLGEITPTMATAVGQSRARKLLIPMNQCDNIVIGVEKTSVAKMVEEAVETLKKMKNEAEAACCGN